MDLNATTSTIADLDESEVQMLAQMSLAEDEDATKPQAQAHVVDNEPELVETSSSRPRSSSVPHPPKTLWSSFLTLSPSLLEPRPYRYKPLLSKGDFRLLSISRSGVGKQLYFQMTRQRMDDCPRYEAISYTWGSTDRTQKIFHAFTGEVLYITNNCASALNSLYTDSERRLWIDAICINQNDIEERSLQVSMMADIFRNASRTIAYIGESDEATEYLVWRTTRRRGGSDDFRNKNLYESNRGHLPSSSSRDYEFHQVKAAASRSWFSRSWVVQEVLLSRNLVMQAGTDVMDFTGICAILQRHAKNPERAVPGITNTFLRYGSEEQVQTRHHKRFAGWAALDDVRLLSPGIPSKRYLRYWQLFNLLFETAPYQCRDARDKLFALISLFDGDPPEELRPDYSLDVGEVYANISRYFIASEGITLGLSAAKGVHSAGDIPSWAIDWRDEPSLDALLRSDLGDRAQYSAGFVPTGRLSGSTLHTTIPAVPSKGPVLRLRGLRAGVFSSTATLMPRLKIDWLCHHDHGEEPTPYENWRFPDATQVGDMVAVFLGFEVPFVFHKAANGWLLVGECDIEEIMYGQALTALSLMRDQIDADVPPSPLEDFDIV
ncbi:hypothetical protein M409DRAFT_52822 [Zasmidium cellare ATCC 36951]|uniref:Heterokaryon incompatibility domain-containing protein n=1 Tax=Zasmidium cellare ATCC 36951 TaxID=1080233 RepID=A0A6A6CNF9_ZASCE|nr:uncharacterized protein M409DRAFT_52822 [Zasmidium cellare ATCC 36951]KAF2168817.1 hypothetical protein M409DRAFT_52822 [Zasmidium cellare ATCC 36951]